MKNLLKYFLLAIVLWNCDGGIQPGLQEPGFSGTIYFIGEWPDSVKRTHIVLFKEPLLDTSDFSAENLKYVSDEIPYGVTEYNYTTENNSLFGVIKPGEYGYLAVAQSTLETISLKREDWTIAGLYYNPGDSTKPGRLIIPENTFLHNINITCDFDHPPVQPPGGK